MKNKISLNKCLQLLAILFIIGKSATASPLIQSFEISPSSSHTVFVSQAESTDLKFYFTITRPIVGTSYESESISVKLVYKINNTETDLSPTYSFTDKDFQGTTLNKNYSAKIPAGSIGGNIYLKMTFLLNNSPLTTVSSYFITSLPTDVPPGDTTDNNRILRAPLIMSHEQGYEGAIFMALRTAPRTNTDYKYFYYQVTHNGYLSIFKTKYFENNVLQYTYNPEYSRTKAGETQYIDADYVEPLHVLTERQMFLAKKQGTSNLYLVVEIQKNVFFCRPIKDMNAFDKYLFDKDKVRTVNMDLKSLTTFPLFPELNKTLYFTISGEEIFTL